MTTELAENFDVLSLEYYVKCLIFPRYVCEKFV